MQPSMIVEPRGGVGRDWARRPVMPFLTRFLSKFVLDIMPAALASAIGGFLFTQYHADRAAAPQPVAAQATPASAEMMAMVRDEHTMMVNFLNSQLAAEQSRQAAEDADTQTDTGAGAKVADAKAAEGKVADTRPTLDKTAMEASARRIVAVRSAAPHGKPAPSVVAAAAAPHAPLVIAQIQPIPVAADAPRPDRVARDPNSLLAKTLDIKDHVVNATRHMVSMIGDIFDSVGDRISGASTSRPFNS